MRMGRGSWYSSAVGLVVMVGAMAALVAAPSACDVVPQQLLTPCNALGLEIIAFAATLDEDGNEISEEDLCETARLQLEFLTNCLNQGGRGIVPDDMTPVQYRDALRLAIREGCDG